MNKTKKIAIAAVSLVMAGSIAVGLTACGPEEDQTGSKVTLNLAVGHNSTITSTSFNGALGDQITLPDGKVYSNSSWKPAWAALAGELNVDLQDKFAGKATNSNLAYLVSENKYNEVDLYTSDLSYVVEYSNKGTSVLNLANYLDRMPNFKSFLEDNPVVYLSLLQDGMKTTDGSGKRLYVAPYFDGNDTIERYAIARQDWVEKLLNGNTELSGSTAFKDSCSASTSVKAYLGTTGKQTILSTNSDGTGTVNIVKNYDAALNAAKNTSTALGGAYNAIAGAAYNGTSGNIIDIMNAAIAANSGATGAQLVNLYRAYIDAAYQKEDGTAYYTAATRANVFNGYDAVWDADDLAAILRCVMTNASTLVGSGKTVAGIFPRSYQNDRTPDMVRLAGQLYGVRGTDSRYEYTYIDAQGNLQDARNDAELYEALAKMNDMKKEGLIPDYSAEFKAMNGNNSTEGFMMYDYNQTQTLLGFTPDKVADGWNFAPIVNPVSKWTVNSADDTVMRFTESWRSTKTSGLAVNGAVAKDAKKLEKVLALIDYLYSEDGRILMTYGPMSSKGNTADADGFWYAPAATEAQISAGEYFTYKGVKYHGVEYDGKYTPILTDNVIKSFKGEDVNGWNVTKNEAVSKAKTNFTNYARMLIGSTLPVGVKDQSFENQLTSEVGKAGAAKVSAALVQGTLKGMSLQLKSDSWWYTCVPTALPVPSQGVTILDASNMDHLKQITGTQKSGGNKNFYSIFNYIIMYGLDGTYNQQDQTYTFPTTGSVADRIQAVVTHMTESKSQIREDTLALGWNQAKAYNTYLQAHKN